ncbi:hypothetical protein R69919_01732 [Paraburkholderia gardini]|uniref:Uncharacterized protein n=1 Tax=Paraburkholderia gardini TaxID=2823469 RepID=A0ABM8U5D5_9BURK|nr:hypothetical protein R69919_01732 [Paraburkholderia gardini]CAG4903113.1 hypothetical protein R54767_02923 [Paraburkholderia gardini]
MGNRLQFLSGRAGLLTIRSEVYSSGDRFFVPNDAIMIYGISND